MSEAAENTQEFPIELIKILKDFIGDVLTTFPEYKNSFTEEEIEFLMEEPDQKKLYTALDYFKQVYPERFFDILYENQEMFLDSDKNTKFFKNIDFADIWKENISDNTRNIIWKYLQLVLFSLSNNIDGVENFGDTAKLFEAIDEEELKTKLEDVISSMGNIFDLSSVSNQQEYTNFKEFMTNMFDSENIDLSNNNCDMENNSFETFMSGLNKSMEDIFQDLSNNGVDTSSTENIENLFSHFMRENRGEVPSFDENSVPNPDDLQEHLNGLMGGKIGQLAQEIANETASELDIDTDNVKDIGDVFSKLFKNPGKLTNMIRKVSTKLDEKLKSGEIKQSELMKEANEIMGKLGNAPGMKDMKNMFSKMGMGGMPGMGGRNAKMNMGLFKSMMQSNMKKSAQKEKMLEKLKRRKAEREMKKQNQSQKTMTEEEKRKYQEYVQKTFNIDNQVMKKSKIKKKNKKKKGKKKNKNKK